MSSITSTPPDLLDRLPDEAVLPIVEFCVEGEENNLIARPVCHRMNDIYTSAFDTYWERLTKDPRLENEPRLKKLVWEIQQGPSLTPFKKFQQLNLKCGIVTKGQMRVTFQSFVTLQKKCDDSLWTIWQRIERRCGLQTINNLPDIRNRLNVITLDQVTELNLSESRLQIVPPEIVKLTHLQCLEISCNFQISELPDLSGLMNLQRLMLSDNEIRILTVQHFKGLNNLTSLDLSCNQISEFPDFSALQNLEDLNMNSNKITLLPPHLLRILKKLKNLDVRFNQIIECPKFSDLPPSLTNFYFASNQIIEFPDFTDFLKLQFVAIFPNPWMFIPDEALERPKTINPALLEDYQAELNYPVTDELGCFYQEIMRQKPSKNEITGPFDSLSPANQRLIYEKVWELSGKPTGDPQWGRDHAFDVMMTFCRAVRKVILAKFEQLSDEQKSAVYLKVWELAGRPELYNNYCAFEERILKWGRTYALQNLPRLADVIAEVTT